MMSFQKEFLLALEQKFGEVNEIHKIQSEGMPEITVFFFEDLPEEGTLTAVTCGLSNANHPDWKFGMPELIVSLDTADINWGIAAGYFASAFYGVKSFSYGDLFRIDDPISDESDMKGYLVFAPSFLDSEQAKFELSDRTIILNGMYPLYEEEFEVYSKVGLEKFWNANGFDLYNTNRSHVKID
jgi:hypothetical protein